jgi:hypothetical protein
VIPPGCCHGQEYLKFDLGSNRSFIGLIGSSGLNYLKFN